MLLNKLLRYELGKRVSSSSGATSRPSLRVQAGALDQAYLRHWAAELGIGELLEADLRGERPPAPGADPQQGRLF